MNIRTTGLVLALAAALFQAGCATLIDGGTEKLALHSVPEGAHVSLNGTPLGITPLDVQVDRWEEGILEFTLDGYAPETRALSSRFNETTLVNLAWIAFFPVLPVAFIVDLATGAMFRAKDADLRVAMSRVGAEPEKAKE